MAADLQSSALYRLAELIIVGYSPLSGSRVGIGGLQLGYRDAGGSLHYAGGVGTGFDEAELRRLRDRLEPMQIPAPEKLLIAGDPIEKGTIWVRPELIAELKYTGWAGSGLARQPGWPVSDTSGWPVGLAVSWTVVPDCPLNCDSA